MASNLPSTNIMQNTTINSTNGHGNSTQHRPKTAIIRLNNDLKALMTDAPEGCSASPISDDDIFEWKACVFGPTDTPWVGGLYHLRLQFKANYPQEPPKVRFVSRMFHPNIFKDGSLCLDIIQKEWSPIYTVSTILTSIQSLLQDPNPNSPADKEAAKLFLENRKAYNRMVRKCVEESL